jgi:hypothetical protein
MGGHLGGRLGMGSTLLLGLNREPETRELVRWLDSARLDQFFNKPSDCFCSFC